MRKTTIISLIAVFILFFFCIIIPALLLFWRGAGDFVLSLLRLAVGNASTAWICAKAVKALDASFAATLATFSVSTILYMFFLEQSNTRHRGFLRRELISIFPKAVFLYQFSCAALTGILLLFDKQGQLFFFLYALPLQLLLSLFMAAMILFYTRIEWLDLMILLQTCRLLDSMAKNKRYCGSQESEYANEILRKVAFDAGGYYTQGEFHEMEGLLQRLLKRIIPSLQLGAKTNAEQVVTEAYLLANSATRAMTSGYEYKVKTSSLPGEPCDADMQMLVKLLSNYTSLVASLSGANLEPPQSTIYEQKIALTLLVGTACGALDSLGETYTAWFFSYLSDFRYNMDGICPSLFNRFMMAMYARGYFLVINQRSYDKIERSIWIFRNIRQFQLNFNIQNKHDIYDFWQVWSKLEGASLYGSPREINRLVDSLRKQYATEYQNEYSEADDVIHLLLFGQ